VSREKAETCPLCAADVSVMTEVIEHVPEPQIFLDAAASLLKTNGQIILTSLPETTGISRWRD
jgi:2-polyprenyl-3-methyl-5-hydroxy-6-metoxy-1,4-benzoquinol methylase